MLIKDNLVFQQHVLGMPAKDPLHRPIHHVNVKERRQHFPPEWNKAKHDFASKEEENEFRRDFNDALNDFGFETGHYICEC